MTELDFYKWFGRTLPTIAHASGLINRIVKPIYNRKKRSLVVSDALGVQMELDPRECVDGNLLFCPQLYDYKEISFLLSVLDPDDVFVDVGSHIGFYSLMASKRIVDGRIIAIEANPATYNRLLANIGYNKANIEAINIGVSDQEEVLYLSKNLDNNSGGQTLSESTAGIEIACRSLLDILSESGIQRIKLMKLDVEGFEYRILQPFTRDANPELLPEYIITEHVNNFRSDEAHDQVSLLTDIGYTEVFKTHYNIVLEKAR